MSSSSSRALSSRRLVLAALTVVLGFLASGALGFVRLGVVAAQFGTSAALDAFTASQRLPEVLFVLVAGGALGSSFIPIYARVRQQDEEAAWRLASAVMTLASAAAALLGLFVALLAEPIMSLLLAGSPPDMQRLAAELTRLQMPTPFIFTISGLLMGLLQAHGRFLLPSLAISMNNVGIMIGALLIAPALPPAEGLAQVGPNNVYGLAWGALLSALLHLAVQLPALPRIKARLRPLFAPRLEGVGRVLTLMLPRVLGLGVTQVNYLVNIILASRMAEGSLAALSVAFSLMFFALGIIAQSVGSAVFPTLAALRAEGDMDGFRARLLGAVRAVVFLSLPATAVCVVLGAPLLSLFERGEWTPTSTQATAWALAFYGLGMVGFALLEVFSRAFYALEDTWTPVAVGTLAMLSNIALSLLLVQVVGNPDELARGAFGGLALANSLTTLAEAALLWALLDQRIGGLGLRSQATGLGAFLARSAGATLGYAIVMAWLAQALPLHGVALGLAAFGLGGVAFFGLALILGIDEARSVPRRLLRRS
ncbi:MAG: murein biosynthesis integral membrane protein MurJ [Anaerolineae bacterium]|nr:murein biosynthesis integral membrane protein MurJ [Anaerolineae bacterium]MDW8171245.1 murein biosynthesis integral membrane protein MurJ [Anaerolineae bacterium]